MTVKALPFSKEDLEKIAATHPTPFHIYDEKGIRDYARKFLSAFSWNPGFVEYYAIKAAPNPYLMKILKEEGFGIDCSSLAELELAARVGLKGDEIMFTSNDTPAEEFLRARELGAIINLDDLSHLAFLEEHAGMPDTICFRYNPGKLKEGNVIIGHPEEAKYGLTREQMFDAYRIARDKGVRRFGIHTMVASNELDPLYFVETAEILFRMILEVRDRLGIVIEFANLGEASGFPTGRNRNLWTWR